jgi:hypothetical protein
MTEPIERTTVAASNDHLYNLGDGPRDRSLRVGDKEREAVSEILRQRHLEGRLDTDELQARVECCMAAKTYADLDKLIADFPRDRTESRWDRRPWTWRLWPVPFVVLPLALTAAIIAGGHVAWLAVPLFFFFVVRPLVWRPWGWGYGRAFWACGPRRTTRA